MVVRGEFGSWTHALKKSSMVSLDVAYKRRNYFRQGVQARPGLDRYMLKQHWEENLTISLGNFNSTAAGA
ncbi:hypothetical protein FRB95_001907 [Tulasnella sp. JGI-2019a]|nr:hypothetical protein FRB95_001907 [Tulasnella sp. JGI-2019a]